jgi:hypothetical protein
MMLGRGVAMSLTTRAAAPVVVLGIVVSCSASSTGASGTSGSATTLNSDSGTEGGGCTPLTATATVNGTLRGKALVVGDVFSVLHLATPDSGAQDTVTVGIVDYRGACALRPTQALKASSNILALHLMGNVPVSPGVYTVPTTATAQFATYDAACNVSGEDATVGTITVASSNACGLAGTLDLTLAGDHVTGSFTAPNCAPVGPGGNQCI